MGRDNLLRLASIYIIVFISLIDHSTIAPVITQYAKKLGASDTVAGLIAASYSIAAIFMLPVVGFLLNKFLRTRIIQILLLLDTVVTYLYTAPLNPYQLLVVRLVHGAADAGVFPGILAIFRDIVIRRLGLNLTIYWILAATPIIIGNYITRHLVSTYGFHSVFFFVASLYLLGLVLSLYIHQEYRSIILSRKENINASIERIDPIILATAYLAGFALYLALGVVIGSMGLLISSRFGVSRELASAEVASWSMYSSLVSLIFILTLTSYMTRGSRNLLITLLIGSLSILISMTIAMISVEPLPRILSSIVFGGALGTILPASSKAATDVSFKRRGFSAALLSLSYLLGVSIGAPVSSRILEGSRGIVYNINFLPPMVVSLIVIILISVNIIRLRNRR